MATTTRPSALKLYDLDVTIVSAKHLKNVNWKNGDLKPYVILWVDPDRRQATKPDDYGSTRPVWNERFVLPLSLPPRDSTLTLEIFHSKPSETPKPLVATLRLEIRDVLSESGEDSSGRIKTFELRRPSGRPQGKIRLKLTLVERPIENYLPTPTPSYYYSSAPAPSPLPQHNNYSYRGYSPYSTPSPALSPPPLPYSYTPYSDPHSGYYSSYSSAPPPPRPSFDRQPSYSYGGPGPSAPLDYTPYDYHRRNSGKPGIGLAVGAVAGALGGLALEEGVKYEEEKVPERLENDLPSTSRNDNYGGFNYRREY